MSEQVSRHKEAESRKAREIAQLRKEQRKQSNAIKSLQTQSAVKDQVLKRRIEEVAALKRDRNSRLSTKAAGRLPPKKAPVIFNPKQARTKWETLQRTINRAARTKQTIIELEGELERLVAEREALIRDLNAVKRRQKLEDSPDLASEEDTIRSSLRFVQENITQVQHSIVEIEDGKQSTSDSQNIQSLLDNVRSFEEAKFLLEKLTGSSILQTCETALTQNRLVDNEALLSDVCTKYFEMLLELNALIFLLSPGLLLDQARKQYSASTVATRARTKSFSCLSRHFNYGTGNVK